MAFSYLYSCVDTACGHIVVQNYALFLGVFFNKDTVLPGL